MNLIQYSIHRLVFISNQENITNGYVKKNWDRRVFFGRYLILSTREMVCLANHTKIYMYLLWRNEWFVYYFLFEFLFRAKKKTRQFNIIRHTLFLFLSRTPFITSYECCMSFILVYVWHVMTNFSQFIITFGVWKANFLRTCFIWSENNIKEIWNWNFFVSNFDIIWLKHYPYVSLTNQ